MLLIILVIFALALVFLGYLYKKTEKLGQTVFIGLLLGLGAGALLQSLTEQDLITSALDWINLVGSGYVRLLQIDCHAVGICLYFIGDYPLKSGKLLGQNQL